MGTTNRNMLARHSMPGPNTEEYLVHNKHSMRYTRTNLRRHKIVKLTHKCIMRVSKRGLGLANNANWETNQRRNKKAVVHLSTLVFDVAELTCSVTKLELNESATSYTRLQFICRKNTPGAAPLVSSLRSGCWFNQ